MTGLQEMKESILADSRKAAESRLAAARQEAENLLADAKAQAEAEAQEILARAVQLKENELKKAESGSELEERKILLREKARLIDETLALSLDLLRELPEQEYFDAMKRLVCRNAREGEGVLFFSEKDLSRLPEGYEAELNRAAPRGSVRLSREPGPVPDGFLLIYGDIEQNCSFEALLQSKAEELRDFLSQYLFG